MDSPPLPRSKLTLWALCVVAEVVRDAGAAPTPATPRLRLAMARLAVSTGEGQALDLFWQDARRPTEDGRTDHMKAYSRRLALSLRFEGICERLGTNHFSVSECAERGGPEWP